MNEKGNALFLILIAVALFAALSYAITQSGRNGGGIDREETALKLAEIHNYISVLQTGVQRLIALGCDPAQIDFGNTVWQKGDGDPIMPLDHNPNAPADHSCDLFHPDGGGITAISINNAGERSAVDTAYLPGHFIAFQAAVADVGTPQPELMVEITLVSDALCLAHNRKVGLDLTSIPVETCTQCGRFNGVFYVDPDIAYGDEVPELAGRTSFCIKWLPSGWEPNGVNYIEEVLVVR